MEREDLKQTVKEAIKEWLDEQCARFGFWSARTLMVLGIAALLYFILTMNGWKPPNGWNFPQ